MNVEEKELQLKRWKWAGVISGLDECSKFYGLVTTVTDSDKNIVVSLSDGWSSFEGRVQSESERGESLAYLPLDSRATAIQSAFSQTPPLARVENGELRISVPWGVEYDAGINLDVESVRLTQVHGNASFLTKLFQHIDQNRQELKRLQEKTQHLKSEKSNLQRAKKIIDEYLNSRPERLRVAAQILNEFKKTCRSSKGEEHGPEEDISKD